MKGVAKRDLMLIFPLLIGNRNDMYKQIFEIENELVNFIRPDEAQTREESLRSARSFAKGLIRCGYRPKWLKEFEE